MCAISLVPGVKVLQKGGQQQGQRSCPAYPTEAHLCHHPLSGWVCTHVHACVCMCMCVCACVHKVHSLRTVIRRLVAQTPDSIYKQIIRRVTLGSYSKRCYLTHAQWRGNEDRCKPHSALAISGIQCVCQSSSPLTCTQLCVLVQDSQYLADNVSDTQVCILHDRA